MNNLLFAVDEAGGFGLNGDLPWGRTIKPDLRRFKMFTWRRIVFAGATTIKTLPKLKERIVGRITRSPTHYMDFGLDEALTFETRPQVDKYFIGGVQIIEALNARPDQVKCANVSLIKGTFQADTFLDLDKWRREGGWQLTYQTDASPQVTFMDFTR